MLLLQEIEMIFSRSIFKEMKTKKPVNTSFTPVYYEEEFPDLFGSAEWTPIDMDDYFDQEDTSPQITEG